MWVILVLLIIFIIFILTKFKIVYKVTIAGEAVGYINNSEEFQSLIENQILDTSDVNIAFVDIDAMPEYELTLVDRATELQEEEIYNIIKDSAITTYKLYAITLNNEELAFVNTVEEAEETIKQIKEDKEEELEEIEIGMQELYTTNKDELATVVEIDSAIDVAELKVDDIVKEQEKIKSATIDGVYFSTKPVSGIITSRYGDQEDIRSHAHSGLDIAAPAGTNIVAAADGKVTFSGTMGGYGNLIIITHENGIQSYYGHCSKLYASVGDEVKAGDLIAAVGMTGQATGYHLHFEIRKNGSTINPQKYIYK